MIIATTVTLTMTTKESCNKSQIRNMVTDKFVPTFLFLACCQQLISIIIITTTIIITIVTIIIIIPINIYVFYKIHIFIVIRECGEQNEELCMLKKI